MKPEERVLLESAKISLIGADNQIMFGFNGGCRLEFEPWCELRRGRYQIGRIGAFTYMGGRDTLMRNVASVGRFCSIASNIVAGQVEHPVDFLSASPVLQGGWGKAFEAIQEFATRNADMVAASRNEYLKRYADSQTPIRIGNDVWIGEGAFIRRGVTIGDGAMIASRSVVVKDVPPYAIVGGVPARTIRLRFSESLVERLLALRWWDYGLSILDGIDFRDVEGAVSRMEDRVAAEQVTPYRPEITVLEARG